MTVPTPILTIEIDRQQQVPIYLQICERFRTAIAAGHLRPGDRVPALRSLAAQLNTARGTVELAYTILVDEGYLQMRGAAGTFVSPSLPASVMRSSHAQGVQDTQSRQTTKGTGTLETPGESRGGQAAPRQPAIAVAMSGEPRPLQPGLPAFDAFPGKLWNRLVSRRARSGERAMFAYPDPAG
jgi:GntR family transcriptional regulator/MocR family aminotransferase